MKDMRRRLYSIFSARQNLNKYMTPKQEARNQIGSFFSVVMKKDVKLLIKCNFFSSEGDFPQN